MNAEIRQIKTAAEQGLAEAFASAKTRLPGKASIAAMREAAFDFFAAQGLPHRRVEAWKYTDLRAAMRDAKPLAPAPDAAAKARAKDAGKLADVDCRRLVFVNGAFVPEQSDLKELEQGLSIRSLADALAASDPDAIRHLGNVLPLGGDAAVALNTAFMGDGAVIHVADGARLARPIQLVFVTSGVTAISAYARSLVVVGADATFALVETHEGPDGVDYQVNHALELSVGDRAQVDYVKVTREGDKALHLWTLMAAVGRDAKLNQFFFTTGGAVVRNQLALRFDGEGTNATLGGVSLLKNRQHSDVTLVADHAKGHCVSRELFKSVLDGESRGVFQGKIIVRPGAQKTDGKMMTRSLLLSEGAEADAKPELEIFADDVVCGHGATVGALDEDLLFYLRARGIPAAEAEALLIESFAGEAMEQIADDNLREALMERARAWLAARST